MKKKLTRITSYILMLTMVLTLVTMGIPNAAAVDLSTFDANANGTSVDRHESTVLALQEKSQIEHYPGSLALKFTDEPAKIKIASQAIGGISWSLDASGTFIVSGTGPMPNYNDYDELFAPWTEYKDKINTVIIENDVTSIGDFAFKDCTNLKNVVIPSSVTSIGDFAFAGCDNLKNITIPSSVTSIGYFALDFCENLTDIYYGGTSTQWESMDGYLGHATVHFASTDSDQTETEEYIYDAQDPGANVVLPTERLTQVTDEKSAAEAVQDMVSVMTSAQKEAPTGVDLATLYAETAVAKAARKAVQGTDILINAAAVSDLEAEAKQTAEAVESALVNGGVSTARYISNTVTLTTEELGKISIRIDPDILTTEAERIRVETPGYALTFKVADLKEDLTGILTFSSQAIGADGSGLLAAESVQGSGIVPGASDSLYTAGTATGVSVELPNGRTSNAITLSIPSGAGDTKTLAKISGEATSSKYNPATQNIDGMVNESGMYQVIANDVSFTDIGNKSQEMQKAILYLTSRGIIKGTTATEFSPNKSISRAEIAALLVRALGKENKSAVCTFTDVPKKSWYYSVAASSQKSSLINGFPNNTFQGDKTIIKEQIVAVSARVLKTEMHYKVPGNPSVYLSRYKDSVSAWAQPEVALATRENLVVYRSDGTFSGAKNMTRGDAAIIIYRLFQKIW